MRQKKINGNKHDRTRKKSAIFIDVSQKGKYLRAKKREVEEGKRSGGGRDKE